MVFRRRVSRAALSGQTDASLHAAGHDRLFQTTRGLSDHNDLALVKHTSLLTR